MAASKKPGWHLEPDGFPEIERYWDDAGPTDEIRFRDAYDPRFVGADPLWTGWTARDDAGYEMSSVEWLLTLIPFVGSWLALTLFARRVAKSKRAARADRAAMEAGTD